MTYYRSVGEVPPKRHTQFRQPDGSLYAEELMGEEGFTSDASLLYHRHLPTAIVAADPVEEEPDATRPNHPLLPRHFRTHVLKAGGDPVGGRQLLMANGDVRLSYVVADASSGLYRNAIGDECVYVEAGRARVETVFGALEVGEGDYVVIPTSTTHRWVVDGGGEPLRLLLIEAFGHVRPPRRYLSAVGQLLEHAPYCERDLHGPDEPLLVSEPGDAEVLVRHRAGVDLAAPQRLHPRPAARQRRCRPRQARHRGAGGDGRHLPPAGARAGRPRRRGPGLPLDLGAPPARDRAAGPGRRGRLTRFARRGAAGRGSWPRRRRRRR